MGSIMRRGNKLYLRYIDVDGTERKRLAKGCATLADAKPILAAIEKRLLEGNVGIQPRVEESPEVRARRTVTVAELGATFGEKYTSAKVKDIKTYRREAKNILATRVYPHLGTMRAAEVTTKHVDNMVATLTAEGYAGSSVRSALASLSKVYNWAAKTGLIDCANPVKGTERPPTVTSLEFLSKDEVARLLEWLERASQSFVASPTTRSLHAIVAFCLYTGTRKGEAMGLRWQDVQLDAGRVDVLRSYAATPKSGKSRHVPLNPELTRLLRLWRDRPDRGDDGGLVFPVEGRMGRREEVLELGAVYVAAGVKRPAKPWHCLRHTFASHFMMSGGNILTLQKLLGHSTLTMTMVYSHLAPDFIAGEVARMSFATTKAGVVDLDSARASWHQDGTASHTA